MKQTAIKKPFKRKTVGMFFAVHDLRVYEDTEPNFQMKFAGSIVMLLKLPELLDFKEYCLLVILSFSQLITTKY